MAASGLGCAIVSHNYHSRFLPVIQCSLNIAVSSDSSKTYLVGHNSLLKARANHGLLARLLAPAPDTLAVGRLHHAPLLASLWALLQSLSLATLSGSRGGIGGRDGGARVAAVGVVGRDRVVGGGAVCAAQGRHAPGSGAEGS